MEKKSFLFCLTLTILSYPHHEKPPPWATPIQSNPAALGSMMVSKLN